MKNNFLSFLLLPIILVSCGGGGSSPLVLTVQQFTSFNVNEDESYETVISASTNKPAVITYTISRPSNNANVTISSSGNLSYTPNPNYFGSDGFSITINASQEGQSTYQSKILNVTANVIGVNDIPTIVVNDDLTVYDQSTLIFDDLVSINVTLADIDNTANQLSVYGSIEGQTLPGTFTQDLSIPGGGTGTAEINISSNQYAGLHFMDICVTDESNSSCGAQMQAYFPGNREIKSVDYCDSSGNNCSTSDQYLYYLVGGPDTDARTNYLFIGDQLNGLENRDSFHEALLSSVNLLMESDASDLIDGYFNIIVLEEVALTGVSIFDIRTGCYSSWDASIYCIGEVDRNFMTDVVPNWTVTSFLTTISGRGVAQGSVNIQPISDRSRNVVMHELGHSHGYMGDEYDAGGERTFAEWYGDWSVNTTTVFDPNTVKWRHHIDFSEEIPGVDYDICYNYSDGTIYYRDELSYEECECFMNEYPESDFPGVDFEPGCEDRIGLLEGTYYGEEGDYRSQWINIMWCCFLYYGPVNIDGFAIGSIMNQGFRNYSVNGESGYGDLTNSSGLTNAVTLSVDAVYDQSKLKLKWFVDGEEKPEYENMLSVTFERPADNDWVSYSYQVEDLSGNLFAPNDPLSPTDFYEGNFERSYYYQPDPELTPLASLMPYIGSFEWYDPNAGWFTDESVDSSNMDNFLFAASCCSMGSTFKINWANYQQTSSQMSSSNNVKKFYFDRPDSNTNQKIFNLSLSKDTIKVNSSSIQRPNPKIIKDPIIRKNDIYGLEFYNTDNELIYKLGIGDPFMVRLQHIDMENKEHYAFEAPISNFNIVIPLNINPSYISLIRRNNQNIYSEVNRYILN
tara:strand:- start:340 stop:2895 length:2556 start_codon:yes stop_codon:yes gene_type:complete